MAQGLENLKVLELGGGISAPMACKLLADLGARVIKVEPPAGDPARRRGPFRQGRPDPEASGTFLYLNANKRGVVLDPERADDRETLLRLAGWADLLVHDLPPREMAASGLDYDLLSARNPRLVMLSLTAFGLTGPHRDYAADELTLIHGSGWGWICPGKSTPADRPPIRPFGQHALVQAGLHGAVAALTACYGAAVSGVGEHLDMSVQEVITFMLGRHFAVYPFTGRTDSRSSPVPYEPMSFYPTRDGYLFLICPEQDQWERLVALMGRPEWAADERFATRGSREKHTAELKARLSRWTESWQAEELYHACQRERVGASPVFSYDRLEQQEHLLAREFLVLHTHPRAGTLRVPGAPYRLKEPWWALRRPAPALGEANGELDELLAGEASPPPSAPAGEAEPPLPLSGVRVLDLSWVWAGPHCTMMMALMGAEVIKVESSRRPDLTRRAHLFADDVEGLNRCGYFNQINQGKRSIAVDLSHREGIALIKRLAESSDVMISNFGTGVMEKLGLGAEEMQRVNPALIVALISAFGQTGPNRRYTGYGPLISPLAGISAQTGYADGVPQDVGMAYGDPNGGVYAAVAIAAALLARRENGGTGQVIDVSMWEAMICTGFEGWINHALGNPPHAPMGNRDVVDAPHNVYRCAGEDRWVAIAVHDRPQWEALCRVMERPDLAAEPGLAHSAGRKAREDELDALIGAWCAGRDRWAVTRLLQAAGVPAFPSLDSRDLSEDAHLRARGIFTRWPHAEVGTRTLVGAPWHLARRPNGLGKAAPLLGEDTDAVLEELLGLDAAERARLREAGAIE